MEFTEHIWRALQYDSSKMWWCSADWLEIEIQSILPERVILHAGWNMGIYSVAQPSPKRAKKNSRDRLMMSAIVHQHLGGEFDGKRSKGEKERLWSKCKV